MRQGRGTRDIPIHISFRPPRGTGSLSVTIELQKLLDCSFLELPSSRPSHLATSASPSFVFLFFFIQLTCFFPTWNRLLSLFLSRDVGVETLTAYTGIKEINNHIRIPARSTRSVSSVCTERSFPNVALITPSISVRFREDGSISQNYLLFRIDSAKFWRIVVYYNESFN